LSAAFSGSHRNVVPLCSKRRSMGNEQSITLYLQSKYSESHGVPQAPR